LSSWAEENKTESKHKGLSPYQSQGKSQFTLSPHNPSTLRECE